MDWSSLTDDTVFHSFAILKVCIKMEECPIRYVEQLHIIQDMNYFTSGKYLQ